MLATFWLFAGICQTTGWLDERAAADCGFSAPLQPGFFLWWDSAVAGATSTPGLCCNDCACGNLWHALFNAATSPFRLHSPYLHGLPALDRITFDRLLDSALYRPGCSSCKQASHALGRFCSTSATLCLEPDHSPHRYLSANWPELYRIWL